MDHNLPVIKLLLLRHGKTNYSGIFPDLTKDGLAHVESVALGPVSSWISKNGIAQRDLAIATSPAPRAHGTAWTICKTVEHRKRLFFEDELGPMVWRDWARAEASLLPFRGRPYVDYETEAVFQDSEVFETPNEVRERWYGYLGLVIKSSWTHPLSGRLPTVGAILVSHYEVFSNIVRDLFDVVATEENALRHAEPIVLEIHPLIGEYVDAHVIGEFRGQVAMKSFDLRTNRFFGCN